MACVLSVYNSVPAFPDLPRHAESRDERREVSDASHYREKNGDCTESVVSTEDAMVSNDMPEEEDQSAMCTSNKPVCECRRECREAKERRATDAKRNMDEISKATREGWKKCADGLRAHDESLVKMWKEEIDALLVFAGLFSAVLTTFNAQVYPSLQPDPGVDLSNEILFRISVQLGALFNESSTATQKAPFSGSIGSSSPASASSVWINALWFMSLVFSLASASVGIVVRQWLNHFISPTSTDPEQSALLHCLRYDAGFVRWHVPEILSLLPVLLLISLVLFLLGLLDLLGSLNAVVTGIVTVPVAVLLAFFVFTTVAPSFRRDCPYKSPQSFLSYWIIKTVQSSRLYSKVVPWLGLLRAVRSTSWRHTWRDAGGTQPGQDGNDRIDTPLTLPTSSAAQQVAIPPVLSRGWLACRRVASACRAWLSSVYFYIYFNNGFFRSDKHNHPYASWRLQEQGILPGRFVHSGSYMFDPLTHFLDEEVLVRAHDLLEDSTFVDTIIRPCILNAAVRSTEPGTFDILRLHPCALAVKRLHLVHARYGWTSPHGAAIVDIATDLLHYVMDSDIIPNKSTDRRPNDFSEDELGMWLTSIGKEFAVVHDLHDTVYIVSTWSRLLCATKSSGYIATTLSLIDSMMFYYNWRGTGGGASLIGGTVNSSPVSHESVFPVIDHAFQMLASSFETRSDGQLTIKMLQAENALCTCHAAVLLASLVSPVCYQEHVRARVSNLIDDLCGKKETFRHNDWGLPRTTFWQTLVEVLYILEQRQGDHEMMDRVREDLGEWVARYNPLTTNFSVPPTI